MKRIFFFFIFFTGICIHTLSAQTTSTLKEKISGKWIYQGTEEFGVLMPDSLRMKDWIEFFADEKYSSVITGKEESGSYKIIESTRQIFLSNAVTKKTTLYKIKSLSATTLTLDYQTPDLVHTLYQYKKTQ